MAAQQFKPFVESKTVMTEFSLKALLIGLVMAVILGAANAYLGLKAGMTIAATYPAAVIGMALLRLMKGTILEENFVRTVGSIGESVAAGAIFTIPAFYIAGIWPNFLSVGNYLVSSAIMIVGGVLGIMFVALLRRVMVDDVELPFPESVAAAEIHKTGRSGGTGSVYLFSAMGVGALIQALGQLKLFAAGWEKFVTFATKTISLRSSGTAVAKGGLRLSAPAVSPAYIGVGYIIGPKLASLNFSGGMLAWGLLVPIIMYFVSPTLFGEGIAIDADTWLGTANNIWRFIVRPIAIGGMLMGAGYTLFKMRKSLAVGLGRSISDVKKAVKGEETTERIHKDLPFSWIMVGVVFAAIATFLITWLVFKTSAFVALLTSIVMIIAGFFFAAVSGYLVGIIGSSNNPISGLTLSTLVVTALLMVALGVKGQEGVAAVLGVAAIVCVAAAVAGEMLQDLKAGYILGGTPWKMQVGDLIGVAISGLIMFLPLVILNQGDINMGKIQGYEGGFGSQNLPAPQAGLMALLSRGIVAGEMAWPLIIVGMLMGVGLIMMQVRSPMLICVGMYLPLETTFAIFVGGLIKGVVDLTVKKRQFNAAQTARIDNTGVLLASGLIAGEALIGLLFAAFAFFEDFNRKFMEMFTIFDKPSYLISLVVFAVIFFILVKIPIRNAGSPDEPAPPSAVV